MKKKASRGEDAEASPQYKHAKKLADEARELASKKAANKVVKEYEETVYDTRGRPKKRLVREMTDGKKYRTAIVERKA